MSDRWVGIVASGDRVTVVDAEVPDTGPLVLQADVTWRLQDGEKPEAYTVIHQQCTNYLRENQIVKVLVKASAASRSGVKISHFYSAELRGVVQSAAASVCNVKTVAKAALSRNFGERKVDEYTKDNVFWDQHFAGEPLRAGSREAAILLLAERGQ